MGASFIKGVILSTFLSIVNIPLGIIGTWLMARQYTDSANWAIAQYGIGTLGSCWLYAKVNTTETVRAMSGVVTKDDLDLAMRVARSAPEDTPLEQIKQDVAQLKQARVEK